MADVALRFGATDDGLSAQFRRVNRQLDEFDRQSSRVASSVSNVFGRLGAVVAGFSVAAAVREIVQFADGLEKAAAQTGIGVEALQRLSFVALQTSGDLGSITAAVNRMQRSLVLAGEGSKEATEALSRLGIPVSEFVNLAPDQQFERVARAIASIEDPADRVTAAVGLFGRSGAELLPVLESAGTELGNIDRQFQAIGGPVSASAVSAVDNLGDSFGTVTLAAKSLGTELLALIAPPLIAGLEAVATAVGAIRFAARGGTGDNEIVNLSDEITRLQGKALAFKNSLNPEGRTRFKQISDEIAELQQRLDALTGFGSAGRAVQLETPIIDPAAVGPPRINFPAGPREQTPQERRESSALNADLVLNADFELKEVANQEHLDRLLEQQRAHVESLVLVQEEGSSALAQLRQQFGIQEINFEELKSATIQDIQQSLALSGLQIATALFGQNKKVALAVAAINIAVGATEALKLPFPANLAAVAKVLAQGAQLTASIRNTSIGGGGINASLGGAGGFGAARGGVADEQPATGARAAPSTTIYVNGNFAGPKSMDWLIEELRAATDRDVIVFGGNSRQAIDLGMA